MPAGCVTLTLEHRTPFGHVPNMLGYHTLSPFGRDSNSLYSSITYDEDPGRRRSGAREHALCWRLARDPGVEPCRLRSRQRRARHARSRPPPSIRPIPTPILALADRERIDLTVVGPEAPLERGIVDLFTARGRPIFGPRQAAAQLETSKAFAKDFMARHGVPTARYRVCATRTTRSP